MIIHSKSGNQLSVCFRSLKFSDIQRYGLTINNGWFDWEKEFHKETSEVYGMHVLGNNDIEGVISIEAREENQLIHIGLMEASPHNAFYHHDQKYMGVGKNLLCFAMHISFLYKFEGYVGLEAKMNKNETYYTKLGAIKAWSGIPPYYYFNTESSAKLIQKYMPGGVQWCQN